MSLRLLALALASVVSLLVCVCVQQQALASEFKLIDHDDDYLYRLPYADSESFTVIQSYGSSLSHTGSEYYTVDFRMSVGTAVHAAREGVVIAIEDVHEHGCWSTGCGRYANYVAIEHADGTVGEYFHLMKDGVLVAQGEIA